MSGRELLAPDDRATLLQALRAGATLYDAAHMAHVNRRTFARWMARGRAALDVLDDDTQVPESEQVYVELVRDVETARSHALTRAVTLISRHAETDWRAAAWLLERLDPEHWNPRRRVELTGEHGAPVQVSTTQVDVTDHERTRAVLLAMVDAGMLDTPDDDENAA